jgi:IS605 OrfB family transposase
MPGGAEVARVPAPRSLARAQARLRAVQRRAARQDGPDRRTGRRGSNRCQRTSAQIARIHVRAASIRRDALHKATTRLARRHQVIVIEDLNVAGMMRRKPGAGKGGRGLNRAITDAGLGELRRQLGYKTTWYGSAPPVVADRWYPSSKTCSACGAVKAKLALADRTYRCDHCGVVLDRDLNAAINLARLSEHAQSVEGRPAGSGPVAGRGAIRKTRPAGQEATKRQPRTAASRPPVRRGPPLRKERLPDHETEVDGSGNGLRRFSARSASLCRMAGGGSSVASCNSCSSNTEITFRPAIRSARPSAPGGGSVSAAHASSSGESRPAVRNAMASWMASATMSSGAAGAGGAGQAGGAAGMAAP